MTQIAETCALSGGHFRTCGRLRVTCAKPGGKCSGRAEREPECIGAGGFGSSHVVSALPSRFAGGCDSPDDLSTPAMARPGSRFFWLAYRLGCPWHDIRIVETGGHRRNMSSGFPASVSKWAKSYNLSRSLAPTGRPVSFKRPAPSTRASFRRRSPVPRQSKMTILRLELGNCCFSLDLVGRLILAGARLVSTSRGILRAGLNDRGGTGRGAALSRRRHRVARMRAR